MACSHLNSSVGRTGFNVARIPSFSVSISVKGNLSSGGFSARLLKENEFSVVGRGEKRRRFVIQASFGNRRDIDKSEILQENPYGKVNDVMSTEVVTVSPELPLESIMHHFKKFSGLPVVDETGRCIGVVSDMDVSRHARSRSNSTIPDALVRDVMSSPAIVILEHAPVAFAAGLMLRHRVHRLPVVDSSGVVVGIVSRNDLFEPLSPEHGVLYHMVVGHKEAQKQSDW